MITRCAVYTRKSSEEGLDMAFNSLDAQREAGADYIKSQKHQGWVAIGTSYDDGGYSGGSTDRPGLQKLLADIRSGRVDVVLVYKVDRLSRSLTDFARLMQVFDEHKVSFVSVTQQFNTTTSMGRLTLNMLLSFAQFEREVSGERIRDKIAATKRKGVWICGQPPLGYRLEGTGEQRGLRIVPEEAELVREIYRGYLESGSPVALAALLRAKGRTTKRWRSSRGIWHGGKLLSAPHIYRTLTNPVYIGQISHTRGGKTELWPGLHEPIIDHPLWDRVQARMAVVAKETRHRWTHTHLLKGKIRTAEGFAMSPGSVHKPVSKRDPQGAKRLVRYYISQKALKQGYKSCPVKSVNAAHLDDLVRGLVLDHLASSHAVDLRTIDSEIRDHWIRETLVALTVSPDRIAIQLENHQITACSKALATSPGRASGGPSAKSASRAKPAKQPPTLPACALTAETANDGQQTTLSVAVPVHALSNRHLVVSPDGTTRSAGTGWGVSMLPSQNLVHAIGLAFALHRELLEGGLSVEAIAKRHHLSVAHAHMLLSLTRLSPSLLRDSLTAAGGRGRSVKELLGVCVNLSWQRQELKDPSDSI